MARPLSPWVKTALTAVVLAAILLAVILFGKFYLHREPRLWAVIAAYVLGMLIIAPGYFQKKKQGSAPDRPTRGVR